MQLKDPSSSCRTLVTVCCSCPMVDVGLKATRMMIVSPLLIPPCTPQDIRDTQVTRQFNHRDHMTRPPRQSLQPTEEPSKTPVRLVEFLIQSSTPLPSFPPPQYAPPFMYTTCLDAAAAVGLGPRASVLVHVELVVVRLACTHTHTTPHK